MPKQNNKTLVSTLHRQRSAVVKGNKYVGNIYMIEHNEIDALLRP